MRLMLLTPRAEIIKTANNITTIISNMANSDDYCFDDAKITINDNVKYNPF